MSISTATVVASAISAIILLLEHYALVPLWKKTLNQEMPPLARYVAGVLALYVPITWAYLSISQLDSGSAVTILWGVSVIGGATVFATYGFDRLRNAKP